MHLAPPVLLGHQKHSSHHLAPAQLMTHGKQQYQQHSCYVMRDQLISLMMGFWNAYVYCPHMKHHGTVVPFLATATHPSKQHDVNHAMSICHRRHHNISHRCTRSTRTSIVSVVAMGKKAKRSGRAKSAQDEKRPGTVPNLFWSSMPMDELRSSCSSFVSLPEEQHVPLLPPHGPIMGRCACTITWYFKRAYTGLYQMLMLHIHSAGATTANAHVGGTCCLFSSPPTRNTHANDRCITLGSRAPSACIADSCARVV